LNQWWTEWVNGLWTWVVSLVHPGYGLILWILLAHLWAVARFERKRFGIRLKAPVSLFLRSSLFGLTAGLAFSWFLSGSAWDIRTEDLRWMWGLTLLLSVGGIRLACLGVTAGVLSLASLTLTLTGIPEYSEPWKSLLVSLSGFRAETWLWLAGLLHLAEWALIRLDGMRGAYPVQERGANGRLVEGWMLTSGWPVPLLLFDGNGWLAVPVFLGYGSLTLSKPVLRQKRLSSTLHLLYALLLCGSTALAGLWQPFLWVTAAFALSGHEGLFWLGRYLERRNPPLFVSDERGLRVLAVIPGSPAERMGLKTGDVIVRFNGKRIHSVDDLVQASENATYCKLEVLDEQNDRHIMQKALYEDDARHLGVIGAAGWSASEEQEVKEFRTAAETGSG
jgi:hypothetical protein